MKLTVNYKGTRLGVEPEPTDTNFWFRADSLLYFNGKMIAFRCIKMQPLHTVYKTAAGARANYNTLREVMKLVEYYHGEIAQEAYDELDAIAKQAQALGEAEAGANAEREAKLKAKRAWERVQKLGCRRCAELRRQHDVFFCGVTGEELEERRMPKFDDGGKVMYLFNFEPFPGDGCKYKAEAGK